MNFAARALRAGAFLAFVLFTGSWVHGGGCPYGSALQDGCGTNSVNSFTAPIGGNFRRAAFFTYAPQSGQSAYATRPAWNVAGVDYAVGIPASSFPLKDPFGGVSCSVGQQCNMPSGCVLAAGGLNFTCTGTDFTIDGYDFRPTNGVGVRFNATGNIILKNNYFFVGSSSPTNTLLISFAQAANTVTVLWNYFDGNCTNFPDTATNAFISAITPTFLAQYNAFINSTGSYTSTGAGTVSRTDQYNYGEGMVCSTNGIHAAWTSAQGAQNDTMTLFQVSFNTFMSYPIPSTEIGITAINEVSSNGHITPYTVTTLNIDHNTYVANKVSSGSPQDTVGFMITINKITVTTANILTNFFDCTGTFGAYAQVTSPTIGTLNFTGNKSLLDNSTVTTSVCFGHL